jgi:FkbM family methyltransferase
MEILYGTTDNSIDVTEICIEKLQNDNIITIPSGDFNRASIFTDPVFGSFKKIFVLINGVEYECDDTLKIKINTLENTIVTFSDTDIINKLKDIHSKLQINYGSFNDEFPEQKMAIRYLTGSEKVLEIGGNIGRNSLVIGYVLSDISNNFVSLECDEEISKQLIENRDLNNLNFYIENSALSKRKLIQRDWDTIESDVLLDGYKPVKTITLDELKNKYNIIFDTLVLDCEGAFYYILMDMPEILDNIKLIIMENDYYDISKKEYVDKILKDNNFYVDYQESGGWGPCYNNFFEVWKKTEIVLIENDVVDNDLLV